MKLLKLLLAVISASLFVVACTNTATNNTNQTSNANIATQATPASAPSPSRPAATPDEFATIRATYSAACIRCHKANGEGGVAELDEGQTMKVPSLKEGHALTHTERQLARQIANGGDGMPAFKTRLTPEQIDELVRFIRREFQGQAATPGAPSNAPAPAHK